jgi:hypothetical protein
MKAIVAVVVLLALVSGAYAYVKHVEVSYLTLRTDHLERRIIELESAPLTGIRAEVDAEVGTEGSTSGPTPVPTPTPVLIYYGGASPSPTPDPKPDLLFERIKRDQVAQDLKAEVPGIARLIAPNASGGYLGALTNRLGLYVPVYMASACLGGTEPSREGFRDMVTTGVVRDSSGQYRWNLESQARRVIQAISEKRQEAATNGCLQSYLSPESVADAAPAVDLCLAPAILQVSARFEGGLEAIYKRRAADWFNLPEPREPFLNWMLYLPCGQDKE